MSDVKEKSKGKKAVIGLIKFVIAAALIIAGILLAVYFVKTAPKVTRRGGAISSEVLVETVGMKLQNYRVIVDAMGTVKPANKVIIQPRVTGEIIAVDPQCMPGGFFAKGQKIVQIDPKDYEITLRERQSDIVQINKDIKLEMGMQEIARREYESLKKEGYEFNDNEMELVLRRPQMMSVEAKLASAQAALEKAKLDLERTSIYAPFSGQVLEEQLEVGLQVNPQTNILTFVGTDEYWIELTMPVSQLKWIKIPTGQSDQNGAPVKAFNKSQWGDDVLREGHIIRLQPALETQGRMAKLLASVKDPLVLDPQHHSRPRLLIDMYVSLKIQGSELHDVYVIPRKAFYDGSYIYIADTDNKLRITKIQPIWTSRDMVVVKDGIKPGERLIVSQIGAPVEGMNLRYE